MIDSNATHHYAYLQQPDPDAFGNELTRRLDAIADAGGTVIHISTQAILNLHGASDFLWIGQVVYRVGLTAPQVATAAQETTEEPQGLVEEQVAAIVDETS